MNLPTYVSGTIQIKAYRLLRENVYDALEAYELTPTYWSMLGFILLARDGVRQNDIAKALHVKAPLITTMAQDLLQRGLITSVQNQFDARAKLLAITPEGKKFIKTVETSINKQLTPLLSGLTEKDLKTYQHVLTTIITNAELQK